MEIEVRDMSEELHNGVKKLCLSRQKYYNPL